MNETDLHEDYNTTDEEYPSFSVPPREKIILEVFGALSLVGVIADIIVAVVIIKYRRLRSQKSNIIILNWTLVNAIYLFLTPFSLRINVYRPFHYKFQTIQCIVEDLEYTLMLANVLLVFVLVLYFYIELYHPSTHVKFVKHLNFIIFFFVYALCFFIMGVHIDACYNYRFYEISVAMLILCYAAFIVFMIIINIIHAIKKRRIVDYNSKNNIPLILANIFMSSGVVFFAGTLLVSLIYTAHIYFVIAALMYAVLNPVYNIIVLYLYNKDYNLFLKHIFTCKCCRYSDDELLESPVAYRSDELTV